MRPRTIGHVTEKSPNKCPEDAVRTRVQIRSFAPSVLLLRRTSKGRKLQRRREGQRFLRQEGQHRSRLIGRTFERELGIGFLNTVPPPNASLKAARFHHLAAFLFEINDLFISVNCDDAIYLMSIGILIKINQLSF